MTEPIQAGEIRSEAVEWLWRGRVPRGMISTFAGWPDQGKGLLGSRLAADLTQPTPVAEDTECDMNVLYSAIEDTARIMTKPRLEAAGANLSKVYLGGFRIPDEIDQLTDYVITHNIGCVIMDPFASHLSRGYGRHSDRVRDALEPVKDLCEATNLAVVIVEHALKRVPTNGHILQAIGGVGLSQMSRAGYVLGVHPNDGDQRVLAVAKLNLAVKPKALVFDVETEELEVWDRKDQVWVTADIPFLEVSEELASFDPMSLFKRNKAGSGQMGRPPDKRADAAEWLTNYLVNAGKPMPPAKIYEEAKHVKMAKRTVRRAADDLKVIRKPPGGGPKCTWELPPGVWKALGIDPPSDEPVEPEIPDSGTNWDDALTDLLDEGGEQE